MNFHAKIIDTPVQFATQCAIVFCTDSQLLASAEPFDQALDNTLSKTIELGALKDKVGTYHWFTGNSKIAAKRLLLVSLGKLKEPLSAEDQSSVIKTIASALGASKAKDATVFSDDKLLENAQQAGIFGHQLAQQMEAASYRYTETKPSREKSDEKLTLSKVTLAVGDKDRLKSIKAALNAGKSLGLGINMARQLGNLPPNICTPSYLQALAEELADACPALTSKALTEKQMEKLGMGAFLSVAKGSDESGKLIIMEYRGAEKATSKPKKLEDVSVILGKGITFDSGGISLKPGAGMDEMKFDMCGAASVFGVIKALIEMEAKINVVGLVAAAENMPSGRASKPGDVVTSMSGQTIEILNTDAEGRLVLCDALTYAERYKPRAVIDIATLTGACVIALGKHASGLYANEQQLADNLLAAGENSRDRAWQMPLWKEYTKQLDSNFADMANIGGRAAGSVTAACFLSKYAENFPWAHLDIAGTAWNSGGNKGATGRPVSLLMSYLLEHADTRYRDSNDAN